MADIEKVKQYGRIYLQNFSNIHIGEPPVMKPHKLKELTDRMTNEEKGLFNHYIKMANTTQLLQQQALGRYNQFCYIFADVYHQLTEVAILQENEIQLQRLPVIVTRKQYEELKQQCHKKSLATDTDNNNYMLLWDLVSMGIDYYIELYKSNPRKANPLRKVKKLYEKQQLDSQRLINECLSNPQYYMPEGELPNKWDFLVNKNGVAPGLYSQKAKPRTEHTNSVIYLTELEDYYYSFEELVKLMLAEIEAKTGKYVTDLDLSEWYYTYFTYKELYELDLYEYSKRIDTHLNMFSYDELLQKRAFNYGVAILEEDYFEFASWQDAIDDKGHYNQPNPLSKFNRASLNGYMEDEELRQNHYRHKQQLVYLARLVIRYNTYIVMLKDLVEVEELSKLMIDIERILDKLAKYNNSSTRVLANLYRCEMHHEIYTEEQASRIRELILTTFANINYKELLNPFKFIKKREKDKLLEAIRNLEAFNDIGHLNTFLQDNEEVDI